MRTMYDSVTVDTVPADATMVAGYVDGHYANLTAMRARFPHATIVGIAVFASTDDGHVLDVERGDASPSEAPGWVVKRRAAGVDPSVYCNTDTWPAVRAAFQAAHVPEPHYWIAQWDGSPTIPAGAVAKQHSDPGPYDISSVATYWPGIDPTPAPTPPPVEDDMPYTPAQLVDYARQGALAALESQPGRDAGALADLWWLDHALAGTTTATMSPAQVGLITDIHHLLVQLNATTPPAKQTAAAEAPVEAPAAVPAAVEAQLVENVAQVPAQAPAVAVEVPAPAAE